MGSGVNKGFNVVCRRIGRVEVKCRQLPPDGRIEDRVEVGLNKREGFDHLAIVVFDPDFNVHAAVLAPYRAVWDHLKGKRYRRLRLAEVQGLSCAQDITAAVRRASKR